MDNFDRREWGTIHRRPSRGVTVSLELETWGERSERSDRRERQRASPAPASLLAGMRENGLGEKIDRPRVTRARGEISSKNWYRSRQTVGSWYIPVTPRLGSSISVKIAHGDRKGRTRRRARSSLDGSHVDRGRWSQA